MLDFNVGRIYRTNKTEGTASDSRSRPRFGGAGGAAGGGGDGNGSRSDGAVRKGCQFYTLCLEWRPGHIRHYKQFSWSLDSNRISHGRKKSGDPPTSATHSSIFLPIYLNLNEN